MQLKKRAAKKPSSAFLDYRMRFRPEEIEIIKEAAANRGLGFNMFVRLVSVGTAKRVLKEAPREELVGRYLDADSVRNPGRQPLESALE